ncbi:uncharacterized protein A4U43_C03F30460 [Asparagus officinalis]|uniref:Trichome birefringence-like C-terminal domain-containing protein n=1 Tax=Asparagus officinalis TaxID=4686 RepID=A0A5P1FEW7_ASPOF|nr:uncharacterized protein A4U43_C03F30460 [Asparagus officinalis]
MPDSQKPYAKQFDSVLTFVSESNQVEELKWYRDATFHTTAWYFSSYNFTVAFIWSPFLVQPETPTVDTHSPTILLENSTIVGCHKCKLDNVPQTGICYVYHRAMELAFNFMIASAHKPLVIYRTHSPNHFERGDWQHGGYCNKTLPYKEGEFDGSEQDQELQAIGREEFMKAVEMARVNIYEPDSFGDVGCLPSLVASTRWASR